MILLARRRGEEALYQVRSKSDEVSGVYREKQLMAALPWPSKSWKDYFSVIVALKVEADA